jgi:voltage-gated potassium channel Kch
LIIFVTPFLPRDSFIEELYFKIVFLIIGFASYFIIRKIRISRIIAFITFIVIILNFILDNNIFSYAAQVGLSIMIINAFVLVLKEAISLKGETQNMILVSITGYLIIGLIGGFLSAILAYINPNSFYHSTGIELDLYNFIYYGFVTMTTLGYGDIIPITEKSQALALFLVITGQLFLTVIIAINIAKFIQKK